MIQQMRGRPSSNTASSLLAVHSSSGGNLFSSTSFELFIEIRMVAAYRPLPSFQSYS